MIAVLGLTGCSKEDDRYVSGHAPVVDLNAITDAFSPSDENILPLIRVYNEEWTAHLNGSREESGIKKLDEAIWTVEADLNYERGNALAMLDSLFDSVSVTVPLVIIDGIPSVSDTSLYRAEEFLLARIPIDSIDHPVRLIDLAATSVRERDATVTAYVYRRYRPYMPAPPSEGCYFMGNNPSGPYPASNVMNDWLHYHEFLEIDQGSSDVHPPFFTTVSAFHYLSTTDAYGVLGGYTVYFGSNVPPGPGWLGSGSAGWQVRYPAYWNEHMEMKNWYMAVHGAGPGDVMMEQSYHTTYIPLCCSPMDYGSPYYPMGPYDHYYKFKHGNSVRIPE